MGAIYLLSMPDVLKNAGLDVDTYAGWQIRGRSTGGYDDLLGVQVHQTVSNTKPENDMAYMWRNALAKPIGAIYLARSGKLTVGAAGATNTSGRGGPLGPIPKDQANKYVISIEAANDGYGEPWTAEQQHAYPIACNALVAAYDLDFQIPGIHAHFEWSPGRKVDPRGPSRWATGINMWDMNKFRQDCKNISKPVVPPINVPELEEEEIMVALIIIPPTDGSAGPNPPWLVHVNGATTYIGSEAHAQLVANGVPQVEHNLDQYSHYRKAAGL